MPNYEGLAATDDLDGHVRQLHHLPADDEDLDFYRERLQLWLGDPKTVEEFARRGDGLKPIREDAATRYPLGLVLDADSRGIDLWRASSLARTEDEAPVPAAPTDRCPGPTDVCPYFDHLLPGFARVLHTPWEEIGAHGERLSELQALRHNAREGPPAHLLWEQNFVEGDDQVLDIPTEMIDAGAIEAQLRHALVAGDIEGVWAAYDAGYDSLEVAIKTMGAAGIEFAEAEVSALTRAGVPPSLLQDIANDAR